MSKWLLCFLVLALFATTMFALEVESESETESEFGLALARSGASSGSRAAVRVNSAKATRLASKASTGVKSAVSAKSKAKSKKSKSKKSKKNSKKSAKKMQNKLKQLEKLEKSLKKKMKSKKNKKAKKAKKLRAQSKKKISASGSALPYKPKSKKVVSRVVYDVKYVKNPATGKLEERKVPRKQLFKMVAKQKILPDPLDPSKTITLTVPTAVEYTPNKAQKQKLAKLKAKLQALKRREKKLAAAYSRANSQKIDLPVLEDGAPAPPDEQQVKMAQDLYDEIEATGLAVAKNIREEDIRYARDFAKQADALRQKHWNFFDDMKQKMLVPQQGWIPI